MTESDALTAFAALSQETRLRVLRLLVSAGPEGMAAGALGEAVGGASSSRLAFHLAALEAAGLIASRRAGRFVIYAAVFPALTGLIGFLMRDCCQGHPEICDPALAQLGCAPAEAETTCCTPTRG